MLSGSSTDVRRDYDSSFAAYFPRVVTRKGGKETDNSVLNYVKKHEDESGIIYCATKKNVD